MAPIGEEELREELRRLAPFHHLIDLPYGLATPVTRGQTVTSGISATRVSNLVAHAWPALLEICGGSLEGRRVIDVACSCGGFSIEAAKSGAEYVLGVDVVDRYIEQANLVRRALGIGNVEFRQLAIEELDPSALGRFDVAFCFGLLYNVENPVLAMRKLAEVTESVMLVDTTLDPARPDEPYWRMSFMQGVSSKSKHPTTLFASEGRFGFRPTARAVESLLKRLGFPRVEQLALGPNLEQRYYDGERATFIASRS
jgi:2-polyprenyl-3-methyl-5-hydroxy-6-metoxy-1,4-benzoquinol methylase